jgi:hypothetical protein
VLDQLTRKWKRPDLAPDLQISPTQLLPASWPTLCPKCLSLPPSERHYSRTRAHHAADHHAEAHHHPRRAAPRRAARARARPRAPARALTPARPRPRRPRAEQRARGPYAISDFPDKIFDTTVVFAAAKLVPDVVDGVTDAARLEARFGALRLENGLRVSPDAAAAEPALALSPSGAYTVMMVDPDAPSPTAPRLRSWLHWLAINVPSTDAARGEVVAEYEGPSPPRGAHRYALMAFKQPGRVTARPPLSRKGFQVRAWAREHGLRAEPDAGLFFISSAEDEAGEE